MKYLVAGMGRAGKSAISLLEEQGHADEIVTWAGGEERASITRALDELGPGAIVVKSPGIPPDHVLVTDAQSRELEIIDELEFAWRSTDAPFVAVTGTNGKSTTSHLIATALGGAHWNSWWGNTEIGSPASHFALLPEEALPPEWAVVEASSFQLLFAPTFHPQVAVFTNLTPEHIDYHGSMEAYGAAKRSMFVSDQGVCGHAIVNVDDPFGRVLAEDCEAAGGQVTTYGFAPGCDIQVLESEWDAAHAQITLSVFGKKTKCETRLPGRHNALNFAAAFGAALASGMSRREVARVLTGVAPPAGRCELIDEGQSFDVIVDYAHTGDGLEQILSALGSAAHDRGGDLRLVFGPVGSDDRTNTVELAAAALRHADHITLAPGSLGLGNRIPRMAEMRELLGDAVDEMTLDRAKAIEIAFDKARPGDVVAILGHGTLGRLLLDEHGTQIPHDDREVARSVLAKMAVG